VFVSSFQLTIPVSNAPLMLPEAQRTFGVLRDIGATIALTDRWRPVFDRYLGVLRSRLVSLGGDPDAKNPPCNRGKGIVCPPPPCPGEGPKQDLFCLNIPWKECDIEGEAEIKFRFKKKCD
jgi:hypothetical protein